MVKQIYGSLIDINHADVFTMMNEHSYAAFIGVLSNICMKAHASSNFRDSSYVAAIVISSSMMHPYNNQPDTSFERLKTIFEKMKRPSKDITLGIFLSDDGTFSTEAKIGLKHCVSQSWPMINNKQANKDIITINIPQSKLNVGKNKVRYFQFDQIKDAIKDESYSFVDYNTPIEQLFSFFEKSKCHICYQGGTAWLSVSLGIPTIIIHPIQLIDELHLKFKLFGQDLGNINILNNVGQIEHLRNHPCEHHVYINDLEKTLREFI